MKKDVKYGKIGVGLLGLFGLLTGFSSCNSFEAEPLTYNTEDRVFNPADSTDNPAVKQLFYTCYLYLPTLHNRISDSYLDAASDDGVPSGSSSLNLFWNGLLSASNITNFDGNAWQYGYRGIRAVNLFLSKVDMFPPSAQVPAYYIKQMKAEARLLRAFYYFEMLKRWGGVPLLYDRVLSAADDLNIPRNSIQEVAEYITNEITPDSPTSCYNDLHPAQSVANDADPANPGNMVGHVNQGVALGLLSRLHLYLASPLYNTEGDVSKWRVAANWAKRLIDLNVYELYNKDNTENAYNQFVTRGGDAFPNKEMIMLNMVGTTSISVEQNNAPRGFVYSVGTVMTQSYGYTSPSQNLVDAFLTADGKSIHIDYDPSKGYISEYNPYLNPYLNRDPRLNRFIFCNGSQWLNQTVETFDNGKHRLLSGAGYTLTGYYLKKFLGANERTAQYDPLYHHYQIIRYAEILLNYAEALNESDASAANAEKIVTDVLIPIRRRAGILPGDDDRYGLPLNPDRELLRRIIRNERRIELCFEEHRFWDIRRWKIAEEIYKQGVRGVKIEKDPATSVETISYVRLVTTSFPLHMYYWYPIPRTELFGNTAMKQNEGWSY